MFSMNVGERHTMSIGQHHIISILMFRVIHDLFLGLGKFELNFYFNNFL